ncbi:hypothetical protein ACFQDD_01995 [Halorubrum pallidum]|uniref:DUF3006 domain-containing protein n=1 Tax=Halorubrum pallidum TaxID=1526114 RepID=A0ABD5T352_9EURY
MPETDDDRVIHVHTQIGEREGVILEVRPEGQEYPLERDMSHLTDDEARDVRDQLNDYLRDDEPEVEGHPPSESTGSEP